MQGLHLNTLFEILSRLCNSYRGEIFLCNLEAALGLTPPVLKVDALKVDLQQEADRDIRFEDEDSLLGHVKYKLTKAESGKWYMRCAVGLPTGFSKDGYVVNVMSVRDYDSYYKPPPVSGHDFEMAPRARVKAFRFGASTREYFWAAPAECCPADNEPNVSAEAFRNRLGLVHYGGGTALVALYIKVPADQKCCRPSVIEANPNARFRQVHPERSEREWGYTVDLEKLPATPVGQPISGAPELLVSQVKLAESPDVEFVALGATNSDRDTASSDKAFRNHLACSREFKDIYRSIEHHLDFHI